MSMDAELSNQFSSLQINEIEDVDDQYKVIIKGIESSINKIKSAGRNKAILSSETKKLIQEREQTKIRTAEHTKIDRKIGSRIKGEMFLQLLKSTIHKPITNLQSSYKDDD
ncbi:Uncharacterized protein OBRU01_11086 [Operophtera brumata]|uniref:Endonuclease-reverse transcriptase n=1 Tax=Operophtera brumata TaxID=104452 RepID=A0A0L7LBH4_OPEBR|nr:Uncharacterized protein OBRU01_11086 [Operophtera brumata]